MHVRDEPFDLTPTLESDSTDFRAAVLAISGRWTFEILGILGTRTFQLAELRRALPGITESTLITQLRNLEKSGLVRRVSLTGSPRFVGYRTTEAALTLAPILEALIAWRQHHRPELGQSRERGQRRFKPALKGPETFDTEQG